MRIKLPKTRATLAGPGTRLYADPTPSPDETSFQIDNTSAQYYNSPYYLAHMNQVQPFPASQSGVPAYLELQDFVPTEVLDAINSAGRITFHAVGDTGAAKGVPATAIANEAGVADAMTADVQSGGVGGPAFFFHLGDVIYNFGEAQYYYDQFYEPFRDYDRPIFAIPGNHDGMVFGATSATQQVPTLEAFVRNFCAETPGPSPDSGGLVRTVMTQPGVYFTLDAPYVSIIGLYSNVLDSGAGVISSQGGKFPAVGNAQLAFLQSELKRLKPDRQAGKRAIIIAVHHPPASVDAKHGGSLGVETDLDSCCQAAGLWPDVVLSGHAHLYQRFTRVVNGKQTPYIVSGSGGYAATPPQTAAPKAPYTIGDTTLEVDPIVDFGYLTITTDAKTLSITFKTASKGVVTVRDSVNVDLTQAQIVSGTHAPSVGSARPRPAPVQKKKGKKK
ncbi:MAG TPA: metallophosphoesterase [Terriglobales bacterium]|nr:metallophosphoesterase [Terriglobales bacterium]